MGCYSRLNLVWFPVHARPAEQITFTNTEPGSKSSHQAYTRHKLLLMSFQHILTRVSNTLTKTLKTVQYKRGRAVATGTAKQGKPLEISVGLPESSLTRGSPTTLPADYHLLFPPSNRYYKSIVFFNYYIPQIY